MNDAELYPCLIRRPVRECVTWAISRTLDRIEFLGLLPLLRLIETIHFHIAHTNLFFRNTSFCIQGVPMNNLALIKIVLGVQGNLIWMLG